MSFSADWLALREPADHAALNPEVRHALGRRFQGHKSIGVVDLGCGAGSNLRGTWAVLPRLQNWTLVDYDPKLLNAARTRLSEWADRAAPSGDGLLLTKGDKAINVSFRQADLASGSLASVFQDADLITAAALFDLISVERIEDVAAAITQRGQTFFTVLTYDGHTRWTPAHPADDGIREAFNRHQKTDKGFGPAAGPGGTTALAKAFYGRGYRVLRGTSPWIVDDHFGALQLELDRGFASAARETGAVPEADIASWLKARETAAGAVSVIGHEDLLAVSP
jgi:SAM-dependent methyltransferase